jgi:hypothetical protein
VRDDGSASRLRRLLSVLAAGAMAVGVAACGNPAEQPEAIVAVQPGTVAPQTQTGGAVVVDVPALSGKPLRPDVLVSGRGVLPPAKLHQVEALAPGAVAFATGNLIVGRSGVRVASVDPLSFRRFAAPGTAESVPVWQVVAGGGLVASHDLARRLHLVLGRDMVVTGPNGQPTSLRLGALATTGIPGTDLIVDRATGQRLGLGGPTAVVLNAGKHDPVSLASKVRNVAGGAIEVDLLTAPAYNPVAFLTGSRAAKAFGAFSYKYYPDGTIQPDARWVRSNITSSSVPIFGRVTCHRLMLPQLRGALQDVVKAGLASSLHTYNGCYVPRFIERDPSHAISLHTWGIAIDLDAATNYRGIRGTMDPRGVDIFKRWGFRWGGDWSYSDPMHFEIGALLTSSQAKKRH